MMTPEEILRWDRRKALYHECAHAAVARHFGIHAWVEHWESDPKDPLTEKTWVGCCYFRTDDLGVHASKICLAGVLAEALLDDPETDTEYFLDFFDSPWETLSETDRAGLGLEPDAVPSRELIEEVLSLLRRLWSKIEGEVKDLEFINALDRRYAIEPERED